MGVVDYAKISSLGKRAHTNVASGTYCGMKIARSMSFEVLVVTFFADLFGTKWRFLAKDVMFR